MINDAVKQHVSVTLEFNKGLKPDSIMSVSDWADANRILSQTASSPSCAWTQSSKYCGEAARFKLEELKQAIIGLAI